MIPTSTDAPIYHWPIATVAAIVLNVIFFIAFCQNIDSEQVNLVTPDGRVIASEEQLIDELNRFRTEEEAEAFLESLSTRGGWGHCLSLEFGSFKPWQWITNNFMHANWEHLLSNMVFLWAFGLIVEGKVGAALFTIVYLGIGTIYGLVLQTGALIIGWDGIALGASAAIFGLLALCVAWAPANEFTLVFRFGGFDVSILLYGGVFLAKELGFWAFSGFQLTSQLLHIIGFAIAFPIGLWMVRSGQVDCEGWDLFSYLSGKTGSESTVGKAQVEARQKLVADKEQALSARQIALEAAERAESNRRLHDQVAQAIDQGQIELAIKLQNRLTAADPKINWTQPDLFRVVQALLKAKDYEQALPLMEKHIDLFEVNRFSIQTAMMKIWLNQHQPQRTLGYLQGFNPSFMTAEEVTQTKQLAAAAKKQIAAGDMEC